MNGLKSLLGEPLAIDHRYLPTLISAIEEEMIGDAELEDPRQVQVEYRSGGGKLAADDTGGVEAGSVVAVVPMTTVFTRHGGWWGPGSKQTGEMLTRLDRDPAVGMIALDVDSPGGSVYGTQELADTIYGIRTRGATQIVAVADPLMASAATWTATAAGKVYAIPSADVGSIGVISAYTDWSKFLSDKGIRIDVVRNPSLKARFTGVEPLTDEMRSTMEEGNQKWYGRFEAAMVRNRGVEASEVEAKFGGGETMESDEAVKSGLIDGIATIDEVVQLYLEEHQQNDRRRRAAWAQAALQSMIA